MAEATIEKKNRIIATLLIVYILSLVVFASMMMMYSFNTRTLGNTTTTTAGTDVIEIDNDANAESGNTGSNNSGQQYVATVNPGSPCSMNCLPPRYFSDGQLLCPVECDITCNQELFKDFEYPTSSFVQGYGSPKRTTVVRFCS